MTYTIAQRPGSYDDLYKHFGNPAHQDFARTYIRTIDCFNHSVSCHIAIVQFLENVWERLKIEGLQSLVKSYDGCYVVRPIRGGTEPSLHSWGLAIDLNAGSYPLGSHLQQNEHLIRAFELQGFFWGGNFYHRKDPMHFQFTKPHTI